MTLQQALSILEITSSDDEKVIKQKYRILMTRNHPDMVATQDPQAIAAATEMSKTINCAYEIIQNQISKSGINSLFICSTSFTNVWTTYSNTSNTDTKDSRTAKIRREKKCPNEKKWNFQPSRFQEFLTEYSHKYISYGFTTKYYKNDLTTNTIVNMYYGYINHLNMIYLADLDGYLKHTKTKYIKVSFKPRKLWVKKQTNIGDIVKIVFDHSQQDIDVTIVDKDNDIVAYCTSRFYFGVILPLCEQGCLSYAGAIVKNNSPLEVIAIFRKTGVQFDNEILKKQRDSVESLLGQVSKSNVDAKMRRKTAESLKKLNIQSFKNNPQIELCDCCATYCSIAHSIFRSLTINHCNVDLSVIKEMLGVCKALDEFLINFNFDLYHEQFKTHFSVEGDRIKAIVMLENGKKHSSKFFVVKAMFVRGSFQKEEDLSEINRMADKLKNN